MSKLSKALSCVVLCAALIPSVAMAKVTFKNEDSADVSIVVEPGTGSMVTTPEAMKFTLGKGQTKDVDLSNTPFKGSTFTVTGTVTAPSLYNKCKLLHADHDYNIIFTGGKLGGTICVADDLTTGTISK